MNMIPRKTGLILSLSLVFFLPINASAAEVTAPAASAEQPALQPMSSMQDMMREMRREQDPSKCKTMRDITGESDAPGRMPGMGMGHGKGGMHGENCKLEGGMQGEEKPCMHGQHNNCQMRGGMVDTRIDTLEKRMDMMQMMLEMMMRQSGGRN